MGYETLFALRAKRAPYGEFNKFLKILNFSLTIGSDNNPWSSLPPCPIFLADLEPGLLKNDSERF